MIHHESGLLGVSEISSDMRDLLAREAVDVRAAEAVALFCYQAKKWLGAFAAPLGGLDTLVFSGGIGENCPSIRARIIGQACKILEVLGHMPAGQTDEDWKRAVRRACKDAGVTLSKSKPGPKPEKA
jgi:acetate kinase